MVGTRTARPGPRSLQVGRSLILADVRHTKGRVSGSYPPGLGRSPRGPTHRPRPGHDHGLSPLPYDIAVRSTSGPGLPFHRESERYDTADGRRSGPPGRVDRGSLWPARSTIVTRLDLLSCASICTDRQRQDREPADPTVRLEADGADHQFCRPSRSYRGAPRVLYRNVLLHRETDVDQITAKTTPSTDPITTEARAHRNQGRLPSIIGFSRLRIAGRLIRE